MVEGGRPTQQNACVRNVLFPSKSAACLNFKRFYGAKNSRFAAAAAWPCKKYCMYKHAVLITGRGGNRNRFEFGRKVAL